MCSLVDDTVMMASLANNETKKQETIESEDG